MTIYRVEHGVKTQKEGYCVIAINPFNNTSKPGCNGSRMPDNANIQLQGPQTNIKYPQGVNLKLCIWVGTEVEQKYVSFT